MPPLLLVAEVGKVGVGYAELRLDWVTVLPACEHRIREHSIALHTATAWVAVVVRNDRHLHLAQHRHHNNVEREVVQCGDVVQADVEHVERHNRKRAHVTRHLHQLDVGEGNRLELLLHLVHLDGGIM